MDLNACHKDTIYNSNLAYSNLTVYTYNSLFNSKNNHIVMRFDNSIFGSKSKEYLAGVNSKYFIWFNVEQTNKLYFFDKYDKKISKIFYWNDQILDRKRINIPLKDGRKGIRFITTDNGDIYLLTMKNKTLIVYKIIKTS